MRIEKTIPIFFLVVLLSTVAAACGSEAPEETPSPTPSPIITATEKGSTGFKTPEVGITMAPEEETLEPDTEVDEIESTLSPEPSDLTAAIVSGDFTGTGKPFTFDATQSQAGERSIVGYEWDMGDGTTLFGLSVEHAYSEPGLYTVSLTITTEDGLVDTISKVVEVIDLEEEVTPTAETNILTGTKWLLKNPIRGTTVTLEFSEDTVSGSSGCNSYSASYKVTEADGPAANITFTSISTTNQTCTLEVMAQEQGFLESLSTASTFTIKNSTLLLQTGSGTLTFEQAGA